MFKPNLIGTPFLHNLTSSSSTAVFTPTYRDNDEDTFSANAINAAPSGEFGRTGLNWKNVTSFTAAKRLGLAYQFSVTKPISGDAVGIELTMSLLINIPKDVYVVPMFGKLQAAGSGLFSALTFSGQPTQLRDGVTRPDAAAAGLAMIALKEQVVMNATDPSGTYASVFQIFNFTGGAFNLTWFLASMGVRQLQDQQSIGYRDTRR